jgi:hypothetical protein
VSAPTVPVDAVAAVLVAIDRAALLPMLPHDQARLLARPVALAAAGVPFDVEAARSALLLLDANRSSLAGPLQHVGAAIPPLVAPPDPAVSRARATTPMTIKTIMARTGHYAAARIAVFDSPYGLKEVLAGLSGARWMSERRCWHVPASPAAAHQLLRAVAVHGPRVSQGVLDLAAEYEQSQSARSILVDGSPLPDGDLSDVLTVSGWDHQIRGVAWAEQSSALLLAMKMGAGKTATTIAALNRRQAARILIVCPNSVRAVWTREAREMSSVSWHIEDGTRPSKVTGGRRQDLSPGDRLERAQRMWWGCECGAPVHAFALNYEQLSLPVWKRWRPPYKLDAVVYDEIHRLKSPTGQVSKTAAKWHGFAHFHVGMSGTPLPQGPLDAFGVMRALDPGLYGTTWTGFRNRYAVMSGDGKFPLPGKTNHTQELATKFMSITYRPVVDLKLPPILPPQVREPELEPRARKLYTQIEEELWGDLTPFLAEMDAARRPGSTYELITAAARGELDLESALRGPDGPPSEITVPNILTVLLRLQQLTGGYLADDEGRFAQVSTAKQESVINWLTDEVPMTRHTSDPVVMFCRFRTDLDVVSRIADGFGVRYGEISGRSKNGLNEDARMHADVDLLGVQVQSGGTGIDLTRSAIGGWYSLGYSVSDYAQALARQARPGQTRPVQFVHFVVKDSADQAVYDTIAERQAAIDDFYRQAGVDPSEMGASSPVIKGEAVSLPWD